MTMHVGFTGPRTGMTAAQRRAVEALLAKIDAEFQEIITVHHGCCVGADYEFGDMCWEVSTSPSRGDPISFAIGPFIVGHPPLIKAFESLNAVRRCDELRDPAPYHVRNQAIVDESGVMIATPRESQPQPAGGTWMTIRMALRALRAGKLVRLHVIGPDGSELDHTRWI
jgi:hypothetical protein